VEPKTYVGSSFSVADIVSPRGRLSNFRNLIACQLRAFLGVNSFLVKRFAQSITVICLWMGKTELTTVQLGFLYNKGTKCPHKSYICFVFLMNLMF